MEGSVCLFVGGGQEYYGQTAARDALITQHIAQLMATDPFFAKVQVITGGTIGIPDLFASNYVSERCLDVVSSEHESAYLARSTSRAYLVAGKTQEERRLAVTKLPGIKCALFIQGGQYTTHEMLLIRKRNIPMVCLQGGGGAAGGNISYKDQHIATCYPHDDPLASTDPEADPLWIAREAVERIKQALQ